MEIIRKLSDMAGSATRTPQRDNPYQKWLTQKMVKDGKRCGGDLSELKQIKPKPTAVALRVSGRKPLNLRRSQSQSKSVKPMRAEFRLGIRLSPNATCKNQFAESAGSGMLRTLWVVAPRGKRLQICPRVGTGGHNNTQLNPVFRGMVFASRRGSLTKGKT